MGKPKGFDTQVQDIASAAHLRGVVLMRGDTAVGSLEAADLCRTMRAAHENTRGLGPRHDQVRQIVNSIAIRLGSRGAVIVMRAQWNLLRGYAAAQRLKASEAAGGSACSAAKAREPARSRKGTR
jgi:hypothetical protein